MPTDKEYKETKKIMLNKAKMNPDFVELANYIDKTFSVKTINIIYDTFDREKRPRLNICFEFEREKQSFYDNIGNFNSKKQQVIADKFKKSLKEQKIIREKRFFDFLIKPKNVKYKTDNVWVFFSAFEPIAKIEANESVPQNKIIQLKKELDNEELWEISRAFSGITFFLYTDEQLKRFEKSETRKIWASKYYDILQAYDEFGYFERNNFNIYLDSKENFDNNYDSNWFYYYK